MAARTFATGGVSQCFECGNQLVRVHGGFIFAEIADPDGHRIRVHKQCQEAAAGHGYTVVPLDPPISVAHVHDMDELNGVKA
ncbi:hypothetical protein D3C86_1651090 [compost metagenome]